MNAYNLHPVEAIPQVALKAINHVLMMEGGYVNDAADHGGATNFGISDLRDGKEDGLIDLNLDGIGDVAPSHLTRDQAISIFYRDYWLANQCHLLPPMLGFVLFDMAVNQSAVWARKTLQRLVGVNPDGIIGAKTINAAAQAQEMGVAVVLTKHRVQRYIQNTSIDPSQKRYLHGWLNRAFDVLYEAQKFRQPDIRGPHA